MIFPALTAGYTAILAIVYLFLSLWVVKGRAGLRINHGHDDHAGLHRRIRAHANFAEYVPLILLELALLESAGGNRLFVRLLLMLLLLARVVHPFGMVAMAHSRRQALCRGGGSVLTWAVMLAAAVLLLIRIF